jgi:hypothetical protein
MKGWKSFDVNASGKRSITFDKKRGLPHEPLEIPCGQCIGCRLEYSRQWAIRLMHEKRMHQESCFLTLTYKDENLPQHNSLNKKHFQDFMKKLRFWLDHKKIRFFHCGEYGENFGRPHYHAILFGHEFSDKQHLFTTDRGDKVYTSKQLDDKWTHGLCTLGDVTFESCAYVARYVTKKVTGKKATHHYNEIDYQTGEILTERSPEYVTMSRRPGIGKSWLEKYTTDVFPHDEVIIRGMAVKPPKYYSNLFEKFHPDEFAKIKEARKAAARKPEVKADNTYERLRVREYIQDKKLKEQLKRKIK